MASAAPWSGAIAPQDIWQLVRPLTALIGELALQSGGFCLVGSFSLPIPLRVGDGGHLHLNVAPLVKRLDCIGHKLGSIVRYNGIWHAEPGEDMFPKESLHVGDRNCDESLGLHPFGIVIRGRDNMRETTRGLWQLANDVDPPLGEGPRAGNWL